MSNTKVVAISGVSGAGKTTVVKLLANMFNCPFLLFDDHTDDDTYPLSMKTWLEKGADVSIIKTPKFVNAVKILLAKSSTRFIFIEEPFGRERDAMAMFIDYVILLDQPMELCLTRIIKRHLETPNTDAINSISNYLIKYQDHLREVYLNAANQVRSNADLVVQGELTINNTINYISNWLENNTN
jgi:uridine kinase